MGEWISGGVGPWGRGAVGGEKRKERVELHAYTTAAVAVMAQCKIPLRLSAEWRVKERKRK